MMLYDLVMQSALRTPEHLAVKGPDKSMTYSELDALANRCARALTSLGVGCGDRVGIWLAKSTSTVVAMQAVLRCGAIYVPLDPLSPAARVHTILRDCDVYLLITTQERADALLAAEVDLQSIICLCVDGSGPGMHWHDLSQFSDQPVLMPALQDDAIAYILYTSGSTGKPKGVCISHRNALAFIEWAAEALRASAADRFANHASFHFDVSVLDLYVAFQVGAAVFLIPDGIAYLPTSLVNFLVREELTIWYSVPSVLALMIEHGGFLEIAAQPLRCILFAGEPFPIKYLQRLYARWSHVRFLNLYGPTETNVCTYYEITAESMQRTRVVPIGRACSGDIVWARKDDGTTARPDEEGELIVAGPTVMVGYWGQPVQQGKPYATGDLVRLQEDGDYVYVGRRDQLVKVRGYRIELGDIETTLEEHPAIYEAVVLVIGAGMEARLAAFVVVPDFASTPSLLEIKQYCAERLPRFMIVDILRVLPALPRTRNGKVDRLALTTVALEKVQIG